MIHPPVAVTQRDLTPVTPTSLTFWEKDVYGIEYSAKNRTDTIRAQSPRQCDLIDLAVREFRERKKHSNRLDHHHDHDNAHRDNWHQVKFRDPESEWDDNVEPRC
jgi:hypothetical protein